MFQTAAFPAAVIPGKSIENTIIGKQKFWLKSEPIQIVRIGPETSAKSVL